jgi:hypothetical protein
MFSFNKGDNLVGIDFHQYKKPKGTNFIKKAIDHVFFDKKASFLVGVLVAIALVQA